MPITLGDLAHLSEFGLRRVAGPDDDSAIVAWVHSSDLSDPTPWLEPGQVLLTDGAQFSGSDERFASAYVARLRDCGVLGLGFARGVLHDEIPASLIDACESQDLPLFEIDRTTPFIAVIRHVADVVASDRRERLEWSHDAQRAVARAATRADGLDAILLELSRWLRSWVALFDAAGALVRVPGLAEVPTALSTPVHDLATEALRRGGRSASTILDEGTGITVQTLGPRGRLLGVLVVGARAQLDPFEKDLVASVIALASIALEQRRSLDGALRSLRSGLLEQLVTGSFDVAERTAAHVWGRLPDAPLRVMTASSADRAQATVEILEGYSGRHRGGVFFAEIGPDLVVVCEEALADATAALLSEHGLRGGMSGSSTWERLHRGLDEARHARAFADDTTPFARFDSVIASGLQGVLLRNGGVQTATRILGPVLDLPTTERDEHLRTLEAWFAHNCAWDQAARAIGVHRHTLRNRIAQIERLLAIDLGTFAGRAEVWSAIRMLSAASIAPENSPAAEPVEADPR